MNPGRPVATIVPRMMEKAGISRHNVLTAYARKLPDISNNTRKTHFRLLDVQLLYLGEVITALEGKDELNISEREVLMAAYSLTKSLKTHISELITDNRDAEARFS